LKGHPDYACFHKAAVAQQFMARNAMAIAADAPHSPDLAPSHFYLFSDVKGLLSGESFETGERLIATDDGILWIS
jgi:hypothetical protein